MPPKAPSNAELTLRFKQHRTTILLHVPQSQSFTIIKRELLEAMRATDVSEINGNTVPSDPGDIILGLPADQNDTSKGWVPLQIPEADDGETKTKGVKKGSVLNESPLGAGLKDGALLAFKFREAGAAEDDEWDVVMPSYDDESGSQA